MASSFGKLSPYSFRLIVGSVSGGKLQVPPLCDAAGLPATLTATATTTATVATVSAAAARSTVGLRPSLIDVQRSAAQVSSIELVNGAFPFRIDAHLDKGEPSGLPCIAVGNNVHTINSPIRLKHRAERIFGCPEAEIPYKNILHVFRFLLNLQRLIGQDRTKAV
jgi:hypothetical protein